MEFINTSVSPETPICCNRLVKNKCWTIIVFFLFSICPAIGANEAEKAALRIAVIENNPPFSFALPNGRITGFYIDIWNLWSTQTGQPIEFVVSDYFENISNLKNGEADFHSGLFINGERLEWADFSIPIHSVSTLVYMNNKDVQAVTNENLNKIVIGVGKGSFQESYIEANYPEAIAKTFEDPKETISNLLEGKIDAIVSEQPFIDSQLQIMGIKGSLVASKRPLLTNTVHALIPKGNEKLVEKINLGLDSIPTSKLQELEKRWLPSYEQYYSKEAIPFLKRLSFAQQTWLRTNPELTYAISRFYAPLEFENQHNDFVGISSEYLNLLREKLDLNLVKRDTLDQQERIYQIRAGSIDLLPSLNFDISQTDKINLSNPYVTFLNVIVNHTKNGLIQSLEQLSGKKLGVLHGSWIGQVLKVAHPDLEIIEIETISKALEELQQQEIDAFVGNLAVISQDIKQNSRNNLIISSKTPYISEYSFAIRKGLEPLQMIVNELLSSLDNVAKEQITQRWLAFEIKENAHLKSILRWTAPVVAILVLFISFNLYSNRKKKQEIARRERLEKNLLRASEYAKQVNLEKNNFLSNMSHEIRTPMNAVIGIAHLLNDTKLDEEQAAFLEILNNSANSLLHLVDDILFKSTDDELSITLNKEKFELLKTVKLCVSQIESRRESKNLTFNIHAHSSLPAYVTGDRLRVSQILMNLLSNAIKFSDRGTVAISIKWEKEHANKGNLIFSVKDEGIGMSEEQLARLFKGFSQVDSTITRKYGGTGLGLSICKELCRSMGGDIWAKSEQQSGSQFFFTLDLSPYEKSFTQASSSLHDKNSTSVLSEVSEISDDPENLQKQKEADQLAYYSKLIDEKHILLVDDNPINLMVATKMLEGHNVEIVTAKDGQEAIDKFSKSRFDAVLMDLQMPIVDGFEAARAITSGAGYNGTPIIALSANVMEKDVERALGSGMVSHIAKPVRVNELVREVAVQILSQANNAKGAGF